MGRANETPILLALREDEDVSHAMHYRAGIGGFPAVIGRAGPRLDGRTTSEPHWYCDCGSWMFLAKPNPRAVTGNNRKAAERSHRTHRIEVGDRILPGDLS